MDKIPLKLTKIFLIYLFLISFIGLVKAEYDYRYSGSSRFRNLTREIMNDPNVRCGPWGPWSKCNHNNKHSRLRRCVHRKGFVPDYSNRRGDLTESERIKFEKHILLTAPKDNPDYVSMPDIQTEPCNYLGTLPPFQQNRIDPRAGLKMNIDFTSEDIDDRNRIQSMSTTSITHPSNHTTPHFPENKFQLQTQSEEFNIDYPPRQNSNPQTHIQRNKNISRSVVVNSRQKREIKTQETHIDNLDNGKYQADIDNKTQNKESEVDEKNYRKRRIDREQRKREREQREKERSIRQRARLERKRTGVYKRNPRQRRLDRAEKERDKQQEEKDKLEKLKDREERKKDKDEREQREKEKLNKPKIINNETKLKTNFGGDTPTIIPSIPDSVYRPDNKDNAVTTPYKSSSNHHDLPAMVPALSKEDNKNELNVIDPINTINSRISSKSRTTTVDTSPLETEDKSRITVPDSSEVKSMEEIFSLPPIPSISSEDLDLSNPDNFYEKCGSWGEWTDCTPMNKRHRVRRCGYKRGFVPDYSNRRGDLTEKEKKKYEEVERNDSINLSGNYVYMNEIQSEDCVYNGNKGISQQNMRTIDTTTHTTTKQPNINRTVVIDSTPNDRENIQIKPNHHDLPAMVPALSKEDVESTKREEFSPLVPVSSEKETKEDKKEEEKKLEEIKNKENKSKEQETSTPPQVKATPPTAPKVTPSKPKYQTPPPSSNRLKTIASTRPTYRRPPYRPKPPVRLPTRTQTRRPLPKKPTVKAPSRRPTPTRKPSPVKPINQVTKISEIKPVQVIKPIKITSSKLPEPPKVEVPTTLNDRENIQIKPNHHDLPAMVPALSKEDIESTKREEFSPLVPVSSEKETKEEKGIPPQVIQSTTRQSDIFEIPQNHPKEETNSEKHSNSRFYGDLPPLIPEIPARKDPILSPFEGVTVPSRPDLIKQSEEMSVDKFKQEETKKEEDKPIEELDKIPELSKSNPEKIIQPKPDLPESNEEKPTQDENNGDINIDLSSIIPGINTKTDEDKKEDQNKMEENIENESTEPSPLVPVSSENEYNEILDENKMEETEKENDNIIEPTEYKEPSLETPKNKTTIITDEDKLLNLITPNVINLKTPNPQRIVIKPHYQKPKDSEVSTFIPTTIPTQINLDNKNVSIDQQLNKTQQQMIDEEARVKEEEKLRNEKAVEEVEETVKSDIDPDLSIDNNEGIPNNNPLKHFNEDEKEHKDLLTNEKDESKDHTNSENETEKDNQERMKIQIPKQEQNPPQIETKPIIEKSITPSISSEYHKKLEVPVSGVSNDDLDEEEDLDKVSDFPDKEEELETNQKQDEETSSSPENSIPIQKPIDKEKENKMEENIENGSTEPSPLVPVSSENEYNEILDENKMEEKQYQEQETKEPKNEKLDNNDEKYDSDLEFQKDEDETEPSEYTGNEETEEHKDNLDQYDYEDEEEDDIFNQYKSTLDDNEEFQYQNPNHDSFNDTNLPVEFTSSSTNPHQFVNEPIEYIKDRENQDKDVDNREPHEEKHEGTTSTKLRSAEHKSTSISSENNDKEDVDHKSEEETEKEEDKPKFSRGAKIAGGVIGCLLALAAGGTGYHYSKTKIPPIQESDDIGFDYNEVADLQEVETAVRFTEEAWEDEV